MQLSVYRGPGPAPAFGLPLARGRMPLLWRGRPLKRWRYVGAFGPELMLCACMARIGPARQTFWALWDRRAARLHEGTSLGPIGKQVRMSAGRVSIREDAVAIELELTARAGAVETLLGDGGPGFVWTRKQAGVAARARVAIDGDVRVVELGAVIDDTAGYHRRHTSWAWSAGIGSDRGGHAVGWNLVSGVNDPPSGSERTLWRDGAPVEVGPVEFAPDLSALAFSEGGALSFAPEAQRSHEQNLLVVRSSYRAPFGTFSGVLPGGPELVEGYGVMEHHDAHW